MKKTLSKKRDVVISHLLLRSLQDNEVYCAQWGQILYEVAFELRNIFYKQIWTIVFICHSFICQRTNSKGFFGETTYNIQEILHFYKVRRNSNQC